MAKIYTDVLLLGNELPGLICCALLSKRGIKVTHLPNPSHIKEQTKNSVFDLWPSYVDIFSKKIFHELELALDLDHHFNLGAHFSFVQEGETAIFAKPDPHSFNLDIARAFKRPGADFACLLQEIDTLLLENALNLVALDPLRPAFLNTIKKFIFKKLQDRKMPIMTSKKFSDIINSDPGKLLSISNFLSPQEAGYNNTSLLLAIMCFKYGLNLPKDRSLATRPAISELFSKTMNKHGANCHSNLAVKELAFEYRKLHEIQVSSLDTYMAKSIIDATRFGTDYYWPTHNNTDLPPDNLATDSCLEIKTELSGPIFSDILPTLGFFYCPRNSREIFCQYQILDEAPRPMVSVISSQNNIAPKKYLYLKLKTLNKNTTTQILINEAKKIIERHFTGKLEQEPEIQLLNEKIHQANNADNILTPWPKHFRASCSLAQGLGIAGDFATAWAIYKRLEKVFKYKLPI